jgi:hypothetical protein
LSSEIGRFGRPEAVCHNAAHPPAVAFFLPSARSLSTSGRVVASLMPRVRHRSEAVDIDHGQLVYPSLNRFAIVMDLHELGVSRWAGHEQVKVEAARAVRRGV